MNRRFPEAYQADEAVRFLFRANHVYILFVGLLNLVLGRYLTDASSPGRVRIQRLASLFLLAAAPILVWAFFAEPPQASPVRPTTLLGVVLALAGTTVHVLARGSRE